MRVDPSIKTELRVFYIIFKVSNDITVQELCSEAGQNTVGMYLSEVYFSGGLTGISTTDALENIFLA